MKKLMLVGLCLAISIAMASVVSAATVEETSWGTIKALYRDEGTRGRSDYVWYPINPWSPLNGYPYGIWVSGRGYHLGDDCVRSAGTPVYAIYDGYVCYARNKGISSGWGYLMIVQSMVNNIPFCTVYGHLGCNMYPGEGRWVSRGQYIGTVGSTSESGQSTPHLHLGIHYGFNGYPTGTYPTWCKGYASSTSGWFNPTGFIAFW